MNVSKQVNRIVGAGLTLATIGGSAMADGPDPTVILTAIAAAVVTIGLVGTAILGMKVAVKAFAWVRAAMAG